MKAVQGDSGHSGLKMIEDVYSHIPDKDRAKTAEIFEEHFYKSNRETLSDREDFAESNEAAFRDTASCLYSLCTHS